MFEETDILPQLHQSELRSEVKGYADNLTSKLNQEIKDSGSSDLVSFLQTLSLEDTRRVNELVKTIYSIRETGEIPIDDDEFRRLYDDLITRFEERTTEGDLRDVWPLDNWLDFEIKKLPCGIPLYKLKEDKNYLEMLLRKGQEKEVVKQFNGKIVGFLYNRSIRDFPDEERAEIYQEIDLTGWGEGMNYLGYKFDGGRLKIKGEAGTYLGCLAKKGEIEAEDAGICLGQGLDGATIRAKSAGGWAGAMARSGEIILDEAGDYLAQELRGATVIVKSAGTEVGQAAFAGEIHLDECKSYSETCHAPLYVGGRRVN